MKDVQILVQTIGDVTIVGLRSSKILDGIAIETLGERLFELVDQQNRARLILGFSQVQLLSSMMLGVLVRLQKRASGIRGRVVLCGLKPELMRVFQITELNKLFDFYKNEDEALKSFGVHMA